MKYSIEYTDLGIDYQDEGPWRSYELNTIGDSLKELLFDATISEIDQDGGEIDTYTLDDAPSAVEKAAYAVIEQYLISKGVKS